MEIELLHHVSLNVTDLERSRRFYLDVLGLAEIPRPNFPFPGAWFQVGSNRQLHLIKYEGGTLRENKGVGTRDNHMAVRVKSYRAVVDFLQSRGYREDAPDLDFHKMVFQPHGTAGFPQVYIVDPDRHVIEINAAVLD